MNGTPLGLYRHRPHPRVAARRKEGPPQTEGESLGFNARVALVLTRAVGSMYCAYLFALWALIGLPGAIHGGVGSVVQWLAQTFLQLVLLSVILVGQNIQAHTADKRAVMTYQDAEAVLAECLELQHHLQAQDRVLERIMAYATSLEERP